MADTEQERLVLNTVAAFFNGAGMLEPIGAPGIDGVIALSNGQQLGLSITSIAASADYYLDKSTSRRAQLWEPILSALKQEFPRCEIEILVPEDADPPLGKRDQFIAGLMQGITNIQTVPICRGEGIDVMGLEVFVVKDNCELEDYRLADVWVYFKGHVNYQSKMLELLDKKAASMSKARSCDVYDLAIDIVDAQLVNPRRLRRVIVDHCSSHDVPFKRIYLLRDARVLIIIDTKSGAVFCPA